MSSFSSAFNSVTHTREIIELSSTISVLVGRGRSTGCEGIKKMSNTTTCNRRKHNSPLHVIFTHVSRLHHALKGTEHIHGVRCTSTNCMCTLCTTTDVILSTHIRNMTRQHLICSAQVHTYVIIQIQYLISVHDVQICKGL